MVKGLLKLAYVVAAVSVCAVGLLAPGCSSDDSVAPTTDGSASTGSPDSGLCGDPSNQRNGEPCYPVGPTVCSPLCATGGCVCTKDKAHPGADAGIWVCQSDTSCLPDAPPVDFDAPDFVPPDANVDIDASDLDADASTDDAGDASDADAS